MQQQIIKTSNTPVELENAEGLFYNHKQKFLAYNSYRQLGRKKKTFLSSYVLFPSVHVVWYMQCGNGKLDRNFSQSKQWLSKLRSAVKISKVLPPVYFLLKSCRISGSAYLEEHYYGYKCTWTCAEEKNVLIALAVRLMVNFNDFRGHSNSKKQG